VTTYDVSVPLRPDMPTYAGEPGPRLEHLKQISRGDSANVTALSLGSHTGTHVDAPVHFIDGGAGANVLPLEVFLGPCEVVDATAADHEIGPELVPERVARVLFKTRNSDLWEREDFEESFVRLGLPAAERLVENGVRLVGSDGAPARTVLIRD